MIIIGAGISGLLAGNVFQRAKIFEAGPEGQLQHKAVLRFRSNAVGEATGIDFRKVLVHKGLWDDKFVQPSIQLANLYSKKVIGRLADRSVWNLEPVERFIAPEDFLNLMAENCLNRIEWNRKIESTQSLSMLNSGAASGKGIISTIPMPVLLKMVKPSVILPYKKNDTPAFNFAQIVVRRWRIPAADVFQTIYFCNPDTTLYRASITGDLLIAEYMRQEDDYNLFEAFGLRDAECIPIDSSKQRYGKIAPIDDRWRRNFIFNATQQHGIYSVGRFAIWKNVLTDDVLHDLYVVKRLLSGDSYAAGRAK